MQRFTISLDDALASAFDDFIAGRGYANRSEAVRDLLRAALQRADLAEQPQHQGVACLSYVYNHHERELAERMTALQHAHHDLTVATMHAHLDHEHCLEAVLLRGPTPAVQRFADAVCAERGVHHGQLNLIAVDVHHPQPHRHDAARAAAASAPAHAHDDAHPPGHPHVHLRPRR
jgi:CopG family nickel-responsive transcriptional regulator